MESESGGVMPKYRAIKDTWLDERTGLVADTLVETDKTPVKTGLVDANGIPLYRMPENVSLGFQIREGSVKKCLNDGHPKSPRPRPPR